MKRVKYLVVHCSASAWGKASIIDDWHKGRGWSGIGYHAVICNGFPTYRSWAEGKRQPAFDGKIEPGRDEARNGAHCPAVNDCSVAVCLIGSPGWTEYTNAQWGALVHWCAVKCKKYNLKASAIRQHSDFDRGKPFCASIHIEQLRSDVALKLNGAA